MRLLRSVIVVVAVVAAASCQDMNDGLALGRALQAEYHIPPDVSLSNGHHLIITFNNAKVESLKLDSAGRAGFARSVAAFAKAHFARPSEIDEVTVAFSTVSGTGPLTVTRTEAPYSFSASELP